MAKPPFLQPDSRGFQQRPFTSLHCLQWCTAKSLARFSGAAF